MKHVHTPDAPAAIGPYSQATVLGDLVFTSGQIALSPVTGELTATTVEEQTEQVCRNLTAILLASGSSMDKVIKATCYLADMQDFAAFNSVYERHFPSRPARSCVAVKALPKGALVEIEVIAELSNE